MAIYSAVLTEGRFISTRYGRNKVVRNWKMIDKYVKLLIEGHTRYIEILEKYFDDVVCKPESYNKETDAAFRKEMGAAISDYDKANLLFREEYGSLNLFIDAKDYMTFRKADVKKEENNEAVAVFKKCRPGGQYYEALHKNVERCRKIVSDTQKFINNNDVDMLTNNHYNLFMYYVNSINELIDLCKGWLLQVESTGNYHESSEQDAIDNRFCSILEFIIDDMTSSNLSSKLFK